MPADRWELAATIASSVLGGGAIVEVFRRLIPSSDAALKHEEEFTAKLMEMVDSLQKYALSSETAYRQSIREANELAEIRVASVRKDLELARKDFEAALNYWKARAESLEEEIRRLRSERKKGDSV